MTDTLADLSNVKGTVHHTETFGAVDGPGLRFVFFLQGCPLRCLYCHNPDAVPLSGGVEWTAGQAAREVLRYKSFIKSGGVTFSGGEPLLQAEFVRAVSALLHSGEERIHVAVDTAGCQPLAAVREAIDEADLLLLDIKANDADVSLELTGMDNHASFATLDYCEQTGKPVWLRHVLLRGYTLDRVQLEALARRLRPYRCIERIELLPFHKLGEAKWENMGRPYLLGDTPATTRQELEEAKRIFTELGFTVQ